MYEVDKSAYIAYTVCMKRKTVQLTIRGVPEDVVKVLRKRARLSSQSFNKTVVDELVKNIQPPSDTDPFEALKGSNLLGDDFDQVLKDMRKPDQKLWQ